MFGHNVVFVREPCNLFDPSRVKVGLSPTGVYTWSRVYIYYIYIYIYIFFFLEEQLQYNTLQYNGNK